MSEDLEIGVRVEGDDEAVSDLEKVRLKQGSLGDEARNLSREVRKLSRAEGDNTKELDKLRLAHVRATEAARAASTQATVLSRETLSAGAAASQTTNRMGQMAGAVGNVGNVVGALSPQLQATTGVIGQVGTAASALSASMGPLGVVIAGVTVATGLFSLAMRHAQSETREQQERADALSTSYDRMATAARRAGEASQRALRIQEGRSSVEESTIELSAAREGLTTAESEHQATLGGRFTPRSRRPVIQRTARAVEAARLRVQRAEDAVTAANEQVAASDEREFLMGQAAMREATEARAREHRLATAAERETGGKAASGRPGLLARVGRGGARGAATADRGALAAIDAKRMANEDYLAVLQSVADAEETLAAEEAARADLTIESSRRILVAQRELSDETGRAIDEAIEANAALGDVAEESSRRFADSWRGGIDEVVAAFNDANDALENAGRQTLDTGDLMRVSITGVADDIADSIGNKMVGAMETALDAWLSGAKSFEEAAEDMAHGVIRALTVESIVQVVVELARAIASAASQDYVGAGAHAAAAAAWGVVGGVAAGVGAGVGSFGGGGGAAPSASSFATPAGQQSSGEGVTNIINVFPGGFVTQREVRDGVSQAITVSAREGRGPRL